MEVLENGRAEVEPHHNHNDPRLWAWESKPGRDKRHRVTCRLCGRFIGRALPEHLSRLDTSEDKSE